MFFFMRNITICACERSAKSPRPKYKKNNMKVCKPTLVETQNESINLKVSIILNFLQEKSVMASRLFFQCIFISEYAV